MTCTSCGATIADKAIACYRCGAPTALPPPARRPDRPAARPGAARPWAAVAFIVIGLVLAAWTLMSHTAATWAPAVRGMAAAAGALIAVAAAYRLFRRPS